MLEAEIEFYEAHRAELREQYCGKRLIIVEDQVIGVYDTTGEAYAAAIERFAPGTFMLKYIPENIEDETPILSPFIYG
jgi:hypothetical protein